MKSTGMFTKAAVLASFILLIAAFVAYRAGILEQLPNDSVLVAALEGSDSTETRDPVTNSTTASVKKTLPDSIDRQYLMWSSKSMQMDLPTLELKPDIKKKKRKKARHDSTNTDQQRRTQPSTSK